MKTWQQRHDEEQARRAEVEETLAQVRRQAASPTVCAICGNRGPILPDGWCIACDQIVDDIDAHPHPPAPAPALVEPEPAPVVDLVERIIEIPLTVASQPPASERCACGHKGISHPRWGKCNRLACGCGSFRGCA